MCNQVQYQVLETIKVDRIQWIKYRENCHFPESPPIAFYFRCNTYSPDLPFPREIACRELLRAFNPTFNRVVGGTTKSADVLHEEESCYQIIISQ